MRLLTFSCETCGIIFQDTHHRKFCSPACYHASLHMGRIITCAHCGREFTDKKNPLTRKFCSRKCAFESRKHAQACQWCGKQFKARDSANRKYCSQECQKAEMRSTRKRITCSTCGKIFKAFASSTQKYCSPKCGFDARRITDEDQTRYYGSNWREQRRKAHKRDHYRCQKCDITQSLLGRELDVHHIIPFREFGLERYIEANKLSNLVSLCPSCHTYIECSGF